MELITWSTSSLTSSARVVRRWTIKLRVELIDVYSWNRTFCQDWTQRRWCGGRQDEKHGWTDLWKWHRIKMATGHIVITSVIIILHQVTPCICTEQQNFINTYAANWSRLKMPFFAIFFTVSVNYLRMTIFWHDLHSFWQLFENDHLLACSWTLFFPVSDRTVIWGESRVAPPWQSSSIHILVWYSLVWYCMIWFGLVGYGISMAVVQHSSSAECYQSWYCMVQHGVFWFGMVLYGVVWYSLLSVMAIRREKHRHMGLQSNVCCRQSST